MPLEHAILGFLDREPMSGYDLKTKCFDREAAQIWTADQAQVYRTLDRLVRDRKVTVRRVRQRGKPDRKLFSLTPAGREALEAWLSSADEPGVVRDPFLLKLLFADRLDDARFLALLAEERRGYQERLHTLRSALAERTAAVTARGTRTDAVARIALEGALAPTRAAIDWLDDAADRVAAGIPARSGTAAASSGPGTAGEGRSR
ncbi:MAG: PadR family transcriptional regulator [Coriobacteriia bacterium]|nr:PadR family transcriptional regulator [Coriobacteriia bacterium]